MQLIFGEWLPDQGNLQKHGVIRANNVVPTAQGYLPIKSPTDFYSGTFTNVPMWLFGVLNDSLSSVLFAGDSTGLYALGRDTFETSIKTLANSEVMRGVKFGNNVYVTTFTHALQKISLTAPYTTTDVSAAPKARTIASVGDFLVLGNVDAAGSDPEPNKIYWSDLNAPETWSGGLSDFQLFPDINEVMAVTGTDVMIVFGDTAIYRGVFEGKPFIWSFEKIADNLGLYAPDAWVQYGNLVYFLGSDGFYVTDGNSVKPLGVEKVDRYFFDNLNETYAQNVRAFLDEEAQTIYFSYAGTQSGGTNNRVLIYRWAIDRWSTADISIQAVGRAGQSALTLEELGAIYPVLEDVPASLDSRLWAGTAPVAAFVQDKKVKIFGGSPLAADIISSEVQFDPINTSLITRVYPIIEGQMHETEVAIATRTTLSDTQVFGAYSSRNRAGFCPTRANGRFHAIKLNVTGNWELIKGVTIHGQKGGMR